MTDDTAKRYLMLMGYKVYYSPHWSTWYAHLPGVEGHTLRHPSLKVLMQTVKAQYD